MADNPMQSSLPEQHPGAALLKQKNALAQAILAQYAQLLREIESIDAEFFASKSVAYWRNGQEVAPEVAIGLEKLGVPTVQNGMLVVLPIEEAKRMDLLLLDGL